MKVKIIKTQISRDRFSDSFTVELQYKEAHTKVYMGNFSVSNTNVELTRFLKVFDSDDTLRRNAPIPDYTQEEEIIKQIIKEHINENESKDN